MIRPVHWFLLAMVVLGAGALRFADLANRPNGLFRDEAEKGYSGWSIATTGGVPEFTLDPQHPLKYHPLPWMIDVMGVRTSAIYQYASVPFMWAGGLSVATTRMAAALAGTLAVLLIGILMMRAWGPGIGIAVAMWTALCPWHIIFSRWALQGAFVPGLMGLVLFGLFGVERRRRWGWPLAGAAMGWLFYAYSGAQPLALAWGACLALIYRRELLRGGWPLAVAVVLFLIPVLPTVIATLAPGGSQRLSNVSLWSQPGATASSVMVSFIQYYLDHLNPVFLFWRGDINPRHAIPGVGQLAPVDLVLLPIGLIYSIRSKKPLAWAILAAWLCAPIPAAITIGPNPHALRSFGMALPSTIWSGAGLFVMCDWLRRRDPKWRIDRLVWVAAPAIALSLFPVYWKTYYSDPRAQVAFEKGERDAWTRIVQNHKPGQKIYLSIQAPYGPYFELFFLKMDPRETVAQGITRGGEIVYIDQTKYPEGSTAFMNPGDWIVVQLAPWRVQTPTGPMLTPEESIQIGENWAVCAQKK